MQPVELKPRRRSVLPLAFQEVRDLVGDHNAPALLFALVLVTTSSWFQEHRLLLSVLLGIAALTLGAYARYRTTYQRHADGYCVRWGLLNRHRVDLSHSDVATVDISRTHISLLLNLYNLDLYTAGDARPAVSLKHLSWADVCRIAVDVEALRDKRDQAQSESAETPADQNAGLQCTLGVFGSLRSALLTGPLAGVIAGVSTLFPLMFISSRFKAPPDPEQQLAQAHNYSVAHPPPDTYETLQIGVHTIDVPIMIFSVSMILWMMAFAYLVGVLTMAVINLRARFEFTDGTIRFRRILRLKAWKLDADRICAVRATSGWLSRLLGGHRVQFLTLGQTEDNITHSFVVPFLPTSVLLQLLAELDLAGTAPQATPRVRYARPLVSDLLLRVLLPLTLLTLVAYPLLDAYGLSRHPDLPWLLPILWVGMPLLYWRLNANAARARVADGVLQLGEYHLARNVVYARATQVHAIDRTVLAGQGITNRLFIPGCSLRLPAAFQHPGVTDLAPTDQR